MTANQVVYSGVMTATFSCSGVAGDQVMFSANATGSPGQTTIDTDAWLAISNQPTGTYQGGGVGKISLISGAACSASIFPTGAHKPYLTFNTNGTCTGTVQAGITFSAYDSNFNDYSTMVLASNLQSTYSTSTGWLFAVDCAYPNCTSDISAFTVIAAAKPSVDTPIVTLASTCTLTSPAVQTVVLPNTAVNAFSSVGSTAGATPFSLSFNCNATPTYGLSMVWIFNAANTSAGYNFAAMENTGSATGVGVQIIDSTAAPITSGEGKVIYNSVPGGTNVLQYTARYIKTQPTMTPGTVTGTAVFNASYF